MTFFIDEQTEKFKKSQVESISLHGPFSPLSFCYCRAIHTAFPRSCSVNSSVKGVRRQNRFNQFLRHGGAWSKTTPSVPEGLALSALF
jgi:hypothetical protein